MKIETLVVGPFQVNCFLVWTNPGRALVIDPGCDADVIEAALQDHGLTVAAWLLTHGHADHISALAALHAKHPAPVYIHPADLRWCFTPQNRIEPYYPQPAKPDAEFPPIGTNSPNASTPWNREEVPFQTLETPGHTPGCVCFYFPDEQIVFTGDTLFKGSCGRTDLPGGDGRVLAQSLKKLAALPDRVAAYPGHGESTSIGYEKKTNFFMQQ